MINKTKTKFAWPNKRVKIRWPFDRQRVVWFPRFLGLGLLIVLVSYFSWVWTPPAGDPSRINRASFIPTGFGQARPASTIAFGYVFELRSGAAAYNFVEPCLDMDVCPGYPGSPKIRQIMARPTFRVFGRSLEGFGRLWWMEEQKHYFVVYLEVILSGSSSTP